MRIILFSRFHWPISNPNLNSNPNPHPSPNPNSLTKSLPNPDSRATTPNPRSVAHIRHILILSQAPFHEAPTIRIPKALLTEGEVPGAVYGSIVP